MASPAPCFVCEAYRRQCFGFLQNSLTNGTGRETLKLWSSHKCAVCSLRCKLCDLNWYLNGSEIGVYISIQSDFLYFLNHSLMTSEHFYRYNLDRRALLKEGINTREICYTSTLFITILPILPRWHILPCSHKISWTNTYEMKQDKARENSDP